MRFPFAIVCLGCSAALAAEIPFPNPTLDSELGGWQIQEPEPMTRLATPPGGPSQALFIADKSKEQGSGALSAPIPLRGDGKYTLNLRVLPMSGNGLGVYIQVFDKRGQRLSDQDAHMGAPSNNPGKWQSMSMPIYLSAPAATARVWLHSYSHALVEAYVDDFSLAYEPFDASPPWTPQYKIKPNETDRLTAADVVGPDGIVYPDWRYAGVPGGIPKMSPVRPETFTAVPDDGKDDADAIETALNSIGATGGALQLAEGTYHLDRPIYITADGVVLRGMGADKTRIVFRYALPKKTIRFATVQDGQNLARSDYIEAHANPDGLQTLAIYAGDERIAYQTGVHNDGNTFAIRANNTSALRKAGEHRLRAVATYADGTDAEHVITVNVDPAAWNEAPPPHVPNMQGAINFSGRSDRGPLLKLAKTAARGATTLELVDASSIAAGDRIRLTAPATGRWNKLTTNLCPWGAYRQYDFLVSAVNGNVVTLNQPLRLEYPIEDGSYVQEIFPIRNCGVEDLSFEQTENLWTIGIQFSNAWECWARGVNVKMAGRHAIYTLQAKWCEIRDCVFDDAHFKGGGGTAYVGFETTCDSLMENVTTYKMRHAPLFQWAAAGNVIRNSRFVESDAQWHSGWTNENLFENCVVESSNQNGAYGYGMWASPPEDRLHGPNGPRNVVYNCDISSPKAGLWMGGMNENWIIAYNRFVVSSGPGVYAKNASFDHIIRGNNFVLKDANAPAIQLITPDCSGVEVSDNTIAGGSGKLLAGPAKLALEQRNVLEKLQDLQRPTPQVPSIYQWQREQQ